MASETVPMLPPPDGEVPDFGGPSVYYIIVFSATFGVATLFLALRLYTALFILRRIWLDEGTTRTLFDQGFLRLG